MSDNVSIHQNLLASIACTSFFSLNQLNEKKGKKKQIYNKNISGQALVERCERIFSVQKWAYTHTKDRNVTKRENDSRLLYITGNFISNIHIKQATLRTSDVHRHERHGTLKTYQSVWDPVRVDKNKSERWTSSKFTCEKRTKKKEYSKFYAALFPLLLSFTLYTYLCIRCFYFYMR